MDHSDKRFLIVTGAIGVMGVLLVALVLMRQIHEPSRVPAVSYNPEITALPEQFVTVSGRIEEADPVRRILLVRDDRTTAYVTIQANTDTVIMSKTESIPFSVLAKGMRVNVSTHTMPGSPQIVALHIEVVDESARAAPPGANF